MRKSMYRKQAEVPPEPIFAAEQCKKNAQLARQKKLEDQEKINAKNKIKAVAKAKKLHPKIVNRISKESKRGKNQLLWQREFLFWAWHAPLALVMELSSLLERDGFECKIDHHYDETADLIIKW